MMTFGGDPHALGKILEGTPSVHFRLIHRRIGMLHEQIDRLAMLRKDADTDAGRGIDLTALYRKGPFETLQQFAGNHLRLISPLQALQHHQEFISAKTSRGV